jgi:hypothetical protein
MSQEKVHWVTFQKTEHCLSRILLVYSWCQMFDFSMFPFFKWKLLFFFHFSGKGIIVWKTKCNKRWFDEGSRGRGLSNVKCDVWLVGVCSVLWTVELTTIGECGSCERLLKRLDIRQPRVKTQCVWRGTQLIYLRHFGSDFVFMSPHDQFKWKNNVNTLQWIGSSGKEAETEIETPNMIVEIKLVLYFCLMRKVVSVVRLTCVQRLGYAVGGRDIG